MKIILSYWHFDNISTSFILILCLLYAYAVNFTFRKKARYFFTGIFVVIVSVASPLHFFGEHYLFFAHMIAHVLLLLVAAPLIVMGIPLKNNFESSLKSFSKVLSRLPFLGWFTGAAVMWIWHIPYVYDRLFIMLPMGAQHEMHMNALSYLHMLSLLLAGIIFYWPVINPYCQYRITPLPGILYLSTACIGCSVLGLLITFAPEGMYSHYSAMHDSYGLLSYIRNDWGISASIDQKIGGLVMWVPCCFVYLSVAMHLLMKFFSEKDEVIALPV